MNTSKSKRPSPATQPRRRMTPLKIGIITAAVAIVLLLVALIVGIAAQPRTSSDGPTSTTPAAADGELPGTRSNTHVLDEVGPDAPTLVEYLDFECEACGAFYPYIEQIRTQYDGKLNYAFRYFPLPGHFNSMNAAIAVEAAAQQGRVEDMYNKLFQTQTEWSEQQESRADTFRGYAEALGLDMSAYDAAVADPATQARVQQDVDEGRSLQVSGTPTFYLDGELLELSKYTDLTDALDRAIAD
ncbi:thioredoxin domain-containing protein [Agromyces sp. NBRC 114283]|uniref:DsbA family protein n=1 Tax=Agromyces sp. NBRC 114283 TaxID=2994521 RepID=UPI0024A3ED38|nr:thioredoxin domain-containing protein [Agromyces sp. NBRC 114283]GLU88051.1 hypothetical protein Agsp01_03060 [Agromyces sp. NBRC 114283]